MRLAYLAMSCSLLVCSQGLLATEDVKIQQIRQNYEHLQYKMCNFEPQELKATRSGVESVVFKDHKGQVQMLKVTTSSPLEQNVKEFFYEKNQLIFVKEKSQRFNSGFYGSAEEAQAQGVEVYDPEKTVQLEHAYFFANNQLIAWQDQAKQAKDQYDPLFKQQEQALLRQSAQLLVQAALK